MTQATSAPTAAQVPGGPTEAAIRTQIRGLERMAEQLTLARTDAAARLEATTRPGERARLNGDVRRLDGQISQVQEQLAGLNAQLKVIEEGGPRTTKQAVTPAPTPVRAAPVAPAVRVFQAPTTSTGMAPRPPINEDVILGGLAIVFVLAPLAFALAWRLIRGPKNQVNRAELADNAERLRRIEQAVDTIAVEVERVTENQRFLTKALATENKVRQEL